MKKILIAVLAVTAVLGYSVMAKADSVNSTVPLTFTVQEAFGFTLDKYSYDFGTIKTGEGAETTIGIFCRSNHGRVWNLGIQAPEFVNGSGDTLPSDPGFKMAAWTAVAGDPGQALGTFKWNDKPVPSTTMLDFYESTVAEGGDPFTALTLGLYITLPSALPSGLYSTNMVITMHD